MSKLKNKRLLFSLFSIVILVSFLLLRLNSSPLRSGNTWDDTNAMLRIGQVWLHGMVPFRDVFEQRGIFLYLIYLIANVISQHGYVGLFVVEAINLIFIQVITRKTVNELFDNKLKYLDDVASLLIVLLTVANYSFKNGGTPEEFSIGWIVLGFYCLLKAMKYKQDKYFIWFGVAVALVVNIKYSLIAPFMIFAVLYLVKLFELGIKDNFNRLLKALGWGIEGLGIVALPILIYLLITNSLQSFIHVYFIQNLTSYTKQSYSLWKHIMISMQMGFSEIILQNLLLFILLIVLLLMLNNLRLSLTIIGSLMFTLTLTFWSLFPLDYMLLIVIFGIHFTIITLLLKIIIDKKWNSIFTLRNCFAVNIALLLLAVMFAGRTNPSLLLSNLGKPRGDMISYQFAKDINKRGGTHTLLYYDRIDFGIERFTEVKHSFRFFERSNIELKEKDRALDSIVKHRKAKYIVVTKTNAKKKKFIKKNYRIIDKGIAYKYIFKNNVKAHKEKLPLYLMKAK